MIETQTDWNNRLYFYSYDGCDCCRMPIHQSPEIIIENKSAPQICGYRLPFYHDDITDADRIRFFRTFTERIDRSVVNATYTTCTEPGSYRCITTVTNEERHTERVRTKTQVGEPNTLGWCPISHISESHTINYSSSETADDPDDWEGHPCGAYWQTVEISAEWLEVDGVVIKDGEGTQTGATSCNPSATTYPYFVSFPTFDYDDAAFLNYWDYVSPAKFRPGLAEFDSQEVEFTDEIPFAEMEADFNASEWISSNYLYYGTKISSRTELLDFRYTAFPYEPGRFRFKISKYHLGSKFFITYDIAEVPDEGNPSFFSQDNTVEWTGPGTGDQDDPSWLTDWIYVDPPEVPGNRRVVNVRWTSYTGTKFGVKPEVGFEPFEPPP